MLTLHSLDPPDRPYHTWPRPPGLVRHKLRTWNYHRLLPKTGNAVFDRQIELTLSFEGSGLNDSHGTTGELSRYGVSLASFPELGVQGIVDLTEEQAAEIYYSGVLPNGVVKPFGFLHYKFDTWPDPPAAKCFDMTINPGAGHGLEVLKAALKDVLKTSAVSVDELRGWRDQALLPIIRGTDHGMLLAALRHYLVVYYTDRVAARLVPAAYLRGLLRRAGS